MQTLKNMDKHSEVVYDKSMRQKSFISDSSSLILLAKSDLLSLLCKNARIFITQTISEEIRFNSKDSQLIQDLISKGEITVKRMQEKRKEESGLPVSLGKGERTALALFKDIEIDYLLLDDKKAAIYCRKNSIPYINALLIPHYLRNREVIDDQMMEERIELLNRIGRYARWIKEYVSQNQQVF
jgi:predicted nucleic acid-binding protein